MTTFWLERDVDFLHFKGFLKGTKMILKIIRFLTYTYSCQLNEVCEGTAIPFEDPQKEEQKFDSLHVPFELWPPLSSAHFRHFQLQRLWIIMTTHSLNEKCSPMTLIDTRNIQLHAR